VSRAAAPRRRPRAARALAVLALFALAACANVTAERDRLAERVQQLEAQDKSLQAERDSQAEQLEDLRQERDRLAKQVSELGDAKGELAARQHELEEKSALVESQQALIRELEAEASTNTIQGEGLVTNLAADSLFAPGSADLTPAGETSLARVAGDLRGRPYRIEVMGHVDDAPRKGAAAARYPTAWDLAAARAARVVRFFQSHGLDPARLSAVSLGAQQPVASNESADGRAQNRRIEIRAIPLASAPAAAPSTSAPTAAPTGSP
jgi:chemotaxis protein MotB